MARLVAFASLTKSGIPSKAMCSAAKAGLYASAALLGKIALFASPAPALGFMPMPPTLTRDRDARRPAPMALVLTLAAALTLSVLSTRLPASPVSRLLGKISPPPSDCWRRWPQ